MIQMARLHWFKPEHELCRLTFSLTSLLFVCCRYRPDIGSAIPLGQIVLLLRDYLEPGVKQAALQHLANPSHDEGTSHTNGDVCLVRALAAHCTLPRLTASPRLLQCVHHIITQVCTPRETPMAPTHSGSAGLPGWKTRFNSATDRVSAGYPAFIILDSLL